jgi:ABC transport system ATP-binding/permease protein
VATIEVLTAALREFSGSIVVISHDRTFLEELQSTHVISVRGGCVSMEERSLREEDWSDPLISRQVVEPKLAQPASSTKVSSSKDTAVAILTEGLDEVEVRKARLNAPKTIKKIESSLEKLDKKMSELDKQMLEHGSCYLASFHEELKPKSSHPMFFYNHLILL